MERNETSQYTFTIIVPIYNEVENIDRGGGVYGFVSGDTSNSFGFAILSTLLFKNRIYSIVVFIWATIMAYSRIYLGVHFVSGLELCKAYRQKFDYATPVILLTALSTTEDIVKGLDAGADDYITKPCC